jgi:acyl-CoA thioesterase
MDLLIAPSCSGWLKSEGILSPRSEQKGWIKFKDDRPCDALSLLLMADSFPPPVLASHGIVAWVPTVEYSVSVRSLPDTAWIKAVFRSHYLTSDIVEEDGELWDENGKLLAISRQIAQFRKY